MKGAIFLFAIAASCLAIYTRATTPVFITGFLYFLSACFILTAIHPRTGREQVYFICDHLGVYFPSYQSRMFLSHGNDESWLFVPWTNINDIKSARLLSDEGTVKGISFSVKASEEEEKTFFGPLAIAKRNYSGNTNAEGNLVIGYSNIFQKSAEVLSVMNEFRKQA